MELVPSFYTWVRESQTTGIPICRSNCIERPEWDEGYNHWDAYFIGDRIYAAPVLTSGTVREVCLPKGIWFHGITGERIEADGQTKRTEVSPFGEAPLHYIRGGCVLIKQPYAHRASHLPQTLTVELYAKGEACEDSVTLYEDDGMSQDCDRGAFTEQRFELTESADGI
ncbi:MAG: DUF5110 domain-containing protein, partial [Planctomycetota bacterium]